MVPKDSLYFREMARTKETARKKNGKTPRQNLVPKAPRKKLSQEQVRKNAARAAAAASEKSGEPSDWGPEETYVAQAWDCGPERNLALPVNH